MIPRFATPSDIPLVTSICSDPEVREWTATDGAPPFEAGKWFTGKQMVVLVDGGCFLSNHLGDTTWEVHTNILPSHRGKTAILSGTLALMLGFLGSECECFKTKVPSDNLRAKWYAEALGFRPTFIQEEKWLHGGKMHDLIHYSLGVDDWILRGPFLDAGKAFHKEVEALGAHSHGEDFSHDCYVGAAIALVNAKRVHKALKLYNRWARESGYVPLELLSSDPLVLDAKDFWIRGVGGEMKLELKGERNA